MSFKCCFQQYFRYPGSINYFQWIWFVGYLSNNLAKYCLNVSDNCWTLSTASVIPSFSRQTSARTLHLCEDHCLLSCILVELRRKVSRMNLIPSLYLPVCLPKSSNSRTDEKFFTEFYIMGILVKLSDPTQFLLNWSTMSDPPYIEKI
jgi:hypothetical protein